MAKTFEQRFWEKVDKRGPDECWLWTGSSSGLPEPCGLIFFEDRLIPAPQAALMIAGKWEPGKYARTSCGHRGCVNERHLFAGENPATKLTPKQVAEIRRSNASHRDLGKRYGVSHNGIGRIKRGETWRAI